ncbi:unnamed protein product [Didymodactylos carnosus]|uniref:Uncharacterized protein n=1 Tax=Didymodactylos carnosus TaxID=1234261 RepID=A0A815S1B0_9BILA|nr:unnamed protein product [Didymodactylos carnosus]CAF4347016.1 unnamed protein product [Didymodactylos carnosus]
MRSYCYFTEKNKLLIPHEPSSKRDPHLMDDQHSFAIRNSMKYFETSAKTGENVQEFFETIASDLVGRHNPKLLQSHLPVRGNFAFNYSVPEPTLPFSDINQNGSINGNTSKKRKDKKKLKHRLIGSTKPTSKQFFHRLNLRKLLICCTTEK